MATKTISITDDAYKRLALLKKENESFSMVIARITGKVNLADFFGALSKESSDKIEGNIKEYRNKHKKLHYSRIKEQKEAFA